MEYDSIVTEKLNWCLHSWWPVIYVIFVDVKVTRLHVSKRKSFILLTTNGVKKLFCILIDKGEKYEQTVHLFCHVEMCLQTGLKQQRDLTKFPTWPESTCTPKH